MNWVQRRARRAHILETQGQTLWQEIITALQDACEDFNSLYCNPNKPEVQFALEGGNRITITKTIFADR